MNPASLKGTGRRMLIALLMCLAAGRAVPARASEAGSGRSVDLGVGVASVYDDNLLQYSKDQLSLFEAGTAPDRFSLQSTDDVSWKPYVSLGWSQDIAPGRGRTLRLRGAGEFHARNGTADWRSLSAVWRESFSRDNRLTLSGYLLPHFYLRQLYDEDVVPPYPGLSHYRRAEFDLGVGAASWRQRLGRRTRAEVSYQYEHRAYNRDFIERTSHTHQGVLELERYRLPNHGAVSIHGGYRSSGARGEDGDEVAGAPPDDPDVSYHGILAGVGGHADMVHSRRWRLVAELGYELGTRSYDSDRPADKYHYRREDIAHTAIAALRVTIARHWSLRGSYQLDHTHAKLGTVAPASSDVGSFTENQFGLSVGWYGSLWRQSSAPPDEED